MIQKPAVPEFVLNPRLVTATLPVGDLSLCRVLMLNEQRYPWFLLVPRRGGVEEIIDLETVDRSALMDEITLVCNAVKTEFRPFRLNIADIGNKAAQLHLHIVARNPDDDAWPVVVWSRPLVAFDSEDQSHDWRQRMRRTLADSAPFVPLFQHVDPGVKGLYTEDSLGASGLLDSGSP